MPGAGWQPGAVEIVMLVGFLALGAAGLRLLWLARHRATNERVRLPVLGVVAVPTVLVIGLCVLAGAYHLLAYGLEGLVDLPALPRGRWWLLPLIATGVLLLVAVTEWLERRGPGQG